MSNTKPTLADQLGNSLPIIGSTARSAFVASHFILALGSGLAIMYLVISNVGDDLPPWLGYVLAWSGSMVWFRAIENPLRKYILFAWAYVLASKEELASLSENLKRTGRASKWVTLLLLLVTLTLSLLINIDVAQAVTTEQDSSKEIAQAGAVTTSYDRDVELLREQVKEARTRDAEKVREAQAQAALWIAQAEASKGNGMRDLLHKGNGWAKEQLASAIRRATTRGEKHIAAAQASAKADALEQQLTGYVSTRSASRDTINQVTAGLVAGRHTQYLSNVGRRNWMLFIATVFVLFVFIYTARLLVLSCLELGQDLENDNGDDIITVASRKVAKISVWAGQKLDEVGKDKFVLAPVAAQTEPAKLSSRPVKLSAPPARPVSVLSEKLSVPTPTPEPEKTKDLSATVSVKTTETVGKLTVVIDGKEYSATQTMDKLRKWYERGKNSKTKKTRDKNADNYASVKAATAQHFTFKENGRSVKIEQR
jgi:vacuolar-type H+-ATPase subunit H